MRDLPTHHLDAPTDRFAPVRRPISDRRPYPEDQPTQFSQRVEAGPPAPPPTRMEPAQWSDEPRGWSAPNPELRTHASLLTHGSELDAEHPPTTGPLTAKPFYKRTWVLVAFAGIGLLALVTVGGIALMGGSSPADTALSTTTAAAPTTALAAPPSAASDPTMAPLPPPPSSPVPLSQAAGTTTTSATSTSAAPPAPAPAAAAGGPIVGTIASKDGTSWTISTSTGSRSIAINASTAFTSSKKRHGNDQFEVGDSVTVSGTQVGGTYLAENITANDPPDSSSGQSGDQSSDQGQSANGQQSPSGQGQQSPYGQGQQSPDGGPYATDNQPGQYSSNPYQQFQQQQGQN